MAKILEEKQGRYIVENPAFAGQSPDISYLQQQSSVLTRGDYERTTEGIKQRSTGNIIAQLTPESQIIEIPTSVGRDRVLSAGSLQALKLLGTEAAEAGVKKTLTPLAPPTPAPTSTPQGFQK